MKGKKIEQGQPAPVRKEFHEFIQAMEKKFNSKVILEGRSSYPWIHHSRTELLSRFHDEIDEFNESLSGTSYDERELIDISNFAMFLWTMNKQGKVDP